MSDRKRSLSLGVAAFAGGFCLMAVEVIYPRISAIWFGNILEIWAMDLSMSLLIMALGYAAGSYLIRKSKERSNTFLFAAYLISTVTFLSLPYFYSFVLDACIHLPVLAGALIFSIILMVPTLGLLAFSSPLLVEMRALNDSKAASYIYGISSLGGAVGVLIIGVFLLPYAGIEANCHLLGALLLINVGISAYWKYR